MGFWDRFEAGMDAVLGSLDDIAHGNISAPYDKMKDYENKEKEKKKKSEE